MTTAPHTILVVDDDADIRLMLQRALERAGYQVITGIFSRDGHVRFFTNRMPFRVRVFGSGIERTGEHAFRINDVGCAVPVQAGNSQAGGDSPGL